MPYMYVAPKVLSAIKKRGTYGGKYRAKRNWGKLRKAVRVPASKFYRPRMGKKRGGLGYYMTRSNWRRRVYRK